jgi:NADPH:quinone reductase-like Zn-dependent oxidoreductase
VGQRVFGLADWTRDGSLAEYTAVEARNLAPLPADIDYTVAAAVPISGLTAWQGLFDHAQLKTGQTVLIHGAAGGVGSMAVRLAHELGARVIGSGRAADRQTVLGLGADAFVDLQADRLEEVGEAERSMSSGARSSNARPRSCALAERWSRSSARRRCGRPTAGRSSLSSSRTGSGWRTSPSGCGPGG